MSTLDGRRTHHLEAVISRWGQWRVATILESGIAPERGELVDLDVAGLPMLGGVLRAGLDRPDRPHVVVVGGLGWDTLLPTPPRLSWQSDGGVWLGTVLAALAAGAGEPVELPADRSIGGHYATAGARPGGAARYRHALGDLVRAGNVAGWWVGADGVTRFVARPTGEATGRATEMPGRADVGQRVFGVDSPAEFMPGKSVNGVVIERLIIRQTSDTLVVECWST